MQGTNILKTGEQGGIRVRLTLRRSGSTVNGWNIVMLGAVGAVTVDGRPNTEMADDKNIVKGVGKRKLVGRE